MNAQLNEIRKRLENAGKVDHKAENWLNTLNAIHIQLTDLEAELGDYIESTELDPSRLEIVEKRLTQLYDLARKHKIQPQELIAFEARLQDELNQLNDGDATLENLIQSQADAAKAYHTA